MRAPHLHFRSALEEMGRRLDALPDDVWDRPTPCAEWTVRDLVDHVAEEASWARSVLAPSSALGAGVGADSTSEDPIARWYEARRGLVPSLATADVLDRTIELETGTVRARDVLPELTVDHLVHAWDLARATGGDTHLDPELVTECAAWFDEHEEQWREAGEIGPALNLPDDAGPQQVLLARFGRDDRARDPEEAYR